MKEPGIAHCDVKICTLLCFANSCKKRKDEQTGRLLY